MVIDRLMDGQNLVPARFEWRNVTCVYLSIAYRFYALPMRGLVEHQTPEPRLPRADWRRLPLHHRLYISNGEVTVAFVEYCVAIRANRTQVID